MATPPDIAAAWREASGNAQIKVFNYAWQSFFDDTQLGQAIANQPSNELIVPSTLDTIATCGAAVGLHPDSQVPVAIRFKANAGTQDSAALTLTPGEIIRPNGCAPFSGFDVGLPFGWLGGGAAQLVILKTPDADVYWNAASEVVIQRQRVIIQADGAAPTFSFGLPVGFPWKNAFRYNAANPAAPFPQGGSAVISVTPTRILFRLRQTVLAGAATVTMLVKNTQQFDTGPLLPPTLSGENSRVAITFPAIVGTCAYFPSVQVLTPDVFMAGDDATFCITNTSGNAALTGAYVDIVRYGLI